MIGAIAGDIIGSVYEWHRVKYTTFAPLFSDTSFFTDDTVMTIATAQAILSGAPYDRCYRELGRRHPHRGYGGRFRVWLFADEPKPYGSWGNGSAMRVSPVARGFDDVESVLREAERSASVTHDHVEGIKGAQATALAGFLARTGVAKDRIRATLQERFGYDLTRRIDEIRPAYAFDESCQGTVPEALTAFLESDDLESAIRIAVSLGGDSDTLATIAGGIAESCYGVPDAIAAAARRRLTPDLLEVLDAWERRFPRAGSAAS